MKRLLFTIAACLIALPSYGFEFGTQTLTKTVGQFDTLGAVSGTIVGTTSVININTDMSKGRYWISVEVDLDTNFAADSLSIFIQHSLDNITWRSLIEATIAPGALTVDSIFHISQSLRPDSMFMLPYVRIVWNMHDSLGFSTGDTATVLGDVHNWILTAKVIPYALGGGN